jgi:biotin synthase
MKTSQTLLPAAPPGAGSRWHALAARVLENHVLNEEEGLSLLKSDDAELVDLLAAAYRVRYRRWGNRVHLNLLVNAKSGLCAEDCGYCSQSRVSKAEIAKHRLLEEEKILDGARLAAERHAGTYCIVVSGRTPTDKELKAVARLVPKIKARHRLRVCVSPGLLTRAQAERLHACGVDRINHNLNTSARFYPRVCTTHTYLDRLATLRAVRQAGMEICSGGIVGMGEEDRDVVELALNLGDLAVEAVPINFLNPIPGTPLEGVRRLNPRYCLKVLCLFRLAVPHCELRIAGGRELHLGPLQPLGLYPANSIFVGDYLTTQGQEPAEDYRMIEALGFRIVAEGEEG